jgi:uncharacterized protein YjbI with pentapeptide repeats
MIDWIQLLKEDVNSFNSEIEKVSIDERTMFKGLVLSDFDFSTANVKFCDFSESDLQFSKISGYLLSTCRLEKTNLNNVLLDTIFWEEKIKTLKLIWAGSEQWNRAKRSNNPIIISEGNFLNGNFKDMDFRDVSFTSCIFNKGQFNKMNLSSSSFNASQMESVRFKNIKSYNVSFQRAILDKSSWEDMVLEDSKLNESHLKKTVFKNVTFKNVLFNKANCQEAYFEKCKFIDCHFFGTDLTKTTFSNCNFNNSRIEEGIMIGVTIT